MNPIKEYKIEVAKKMLQTAEIPYFSFNNDLHWHVEGYNLYPTTGVWNKIDNPNIKGQGVMQLIDYLRKEKPIQIYKRELSIERMFCIAKKVKPMNLEKVCEVLHKEIYG